MIRLKAEIVDHVSRHANQTSIPVYSNMDFGALLEAKEILNDTSWEIVSVTDKYVWFKRWVEGQYAG